MDEVIGLIENGYASGRSSIRLIFIENNKHWIYLGDEFGRIFKKNYQVMGLPILPS